MESTHKSADRYMLRSLHLAARSQGWSLGYEVQRQDRGLRWVIHLEKQGVALVARESSLSASLDQIQKLLQLAGACAVPGIRTKKGEL